MVLVVLVCVCCVGGWALKVVVLILLVREMMATQTGGAAHGDTGIRHFPVESHFPFCFCAGVCSVPGRMYYPNELSSVYMERLQFRLSAFGFHFSFFPTSCALSPVLVLYFIFLLIIFSFIFFRISCGSVAFVCC